MGWIYILENKINGKCYVGQTVQKYIRKRFNEHKCKGKTKINRPLNNAINKYGFDNLKQYIFSDIPESLLDYFEIKLIKRLNTISPNGYNLSVGGNPLKHITMEMKTKQANTLKEKWKNKIHPNRGRIFTEEHKKNISLSKIGKPSKLKGYKHTKETKLKNSLSKIGKYIGTNNPNYGNRWTDEMKKSLSEKKKGKPLNISEEKRKEMSERMIRRNIGNKWSREVRDKISKTRIERGVACGDKNPNSKISKLKRGI